VKTPLTLAFGVLLTVVSVARGQEPGRGQEQRLAPIGDLKLESGNSIRDCVIGYRTLGSLNSGRSHAVVFPTAFGWRSAGLASLIGPGKLIDDGKYFVIVVDSLGDGMSSSPSNSKSQPRLDFPEFSIRDMVNAEHKLLAGTLQLAHLRAVIGFSMGEMQAFQWAVFYPGYVDKIVSIVGSPQLTAYDLLLVAQRAAGARIRSRLEAGPLHPPAGPAPDEHGADAGAADAAVARDQNATQRLSKTRG
jgi:homoserine acetyltransferase